MVSSPRISIGPAGCRINRDYARPSPLSSAYGRDRGLGTDTQTSVLRVYSIRPEALPGITRKKALQNAKSGDEIPSLNFLEVSRCGCTLW